MRHLTAMAIVLGATVALSFGQGPTPAAKKPAPQSSATHTHFTCPDPDAGPACKSYSELLEAKDSGVLEGAYACFRKQADQFFVIKFNEPYVRRVPDKNSNQLVIEPRQEQYGSGYFQTYDNGIAASDLMPNLVFSGSWREYLGSMHFASHDINLEPTPEGQLAVVVIDDTQLNIVRYKYKSATGLETEYSLTIQRSTGRFTESYRQGGEVPFLESTGRCVYHSR